MNNIDEELKKLTRRAKGRSYRVEKAGLKSHLLTNLTSRNEKIIKASQVQYKQPFQYSSKFDENTKKLLLESYERFFSNKKSTLTGLKKDIKEKTERLNERFKNNQKSEQEWSKIFYAIDERKDISNILDMLGSGRKMTLISEIDSEKINETLDDLEEYINSHPTDWDLFEFTDILKGVKK